MPIYRDLPVDEIRVAHFNPSKRIERATLTGLLLSIREHGILEPLVLAHDFELADGHRRLACARILKLVCVPTAIYHENSLSAAELWVLLNGDTMSLTPAQWLAAVEAGLPLTTPNFPEKLKSRIERLYTLVEREAILKIVEEGRSPMILDAAERVARYVKRADDEPFLRKAINWLIYTGNAWAIRGVLSDQIPPDLLTEAIEEGKTIGRVWDFVG